MARVPTTVSTSLALFSFLVVSSAIAGAAARHGPARGGRILPVGAERTTQLHFYFQEIDSGPNRSVVRVAQANTTDSTPAFFGALVVCDNPLTEGPELTSRLVGRAQGMYASASQEEVATAMVINFVFASGEYNGSVLTMMGRNPVAVSAREMPIVGGSGYFRLARGYALLRTQRWEPNVGATVEYNITVIHP